MGRFFQSVCVCCGEGDMEQGVGTRGFSYLRGSGLGHGLCGPSSPLSLSLLSAVCTYSGCEVGRAILHNPSLTGYTFETNVNYQQKKSVEGTQCMALKK